MDTLGAHDLLPQAQGDMRGRLIAYMTTLFCLCIVFVSLRFYVRIRVIRNFGKDDWAVAATMFMLFGSIIGIAVAIVFGLGRHLNHLSRSQQSTFLTLVWFSGLGYHVTIIILKCAFLLQYRRAFPLPVFQRLCDIFLAFIACWFVAGFIAPLAICLPIPDQWKPENLGPHHYCYGRWQVWLAHGIIHVITDVLIFVMPLPLIKTLPLTKPQKATLTAVFCLGFITCVISAVRISTIRAGLFDPDASWAMARTVFWSVGEITCAILCLCIPVLRPLLAGRSKWQRWRRGGQPTVTELHHRPHFTTDSSQAWTVPAPSSRNVSRGSIRSFGDIEMRENTWETRNEVTSYKLDPPTTGRDSAMGSTWSSAHSDRRAV